MAEGRQEHVDALRVRLLVERGGSGRAAAARLKVRLPDGQDIVDVAVPAADLGRLLVGETLVLPGWVLVKETAAPAATAAEDVALGDDVDEGKGVHGEEDATTHVEESLDDDEQVELADEDIVAVPQAEDVRPAPGPLGYGSEAPTGTVPVGSALDVQPDEPVVALVRGRWVDALVIRRDRSSIVVQYTVPGPGFADRQQRVDAERVRRWP